MSIKHATLTIILISFLILNGLFVVFFADDAIAVAREIYVDDSFSYPRDGSAEHPYRTISEAIALANDGDTIYVFSGRYNETLVINKRVSLIGGIDDGSSVISRVGELKYLIDITADFVTLENFCLDDSGIFISSQSGALVHISSNNVVLQKNNITQCNLWGVFLDSSDDNTISGNIINDTKGIFALSSNNNVFSNNNITNSTDAGINLRTSTKNIFYQNKFSYNNYGIYSKDCSDMNLSDNTFENNLYHGIYLYGDTKDIIQYNEFHNNSVSGITVDSYDCIISDNIFSYGQVGLNLQKTGCEIQNNTFTHLLSTALSAAKGSSANIIYLNDFKKNNLNAKDQGNNQWDNGTRGNWWDNYNYVDRNHDGIGDKPFTVSTGHQDHYPLGIFLKPPEKPSDPFPADDQENVGLTVTLWVKILDMDSKIISTITFYNAVNDMKIATVRNVVNNTNASCTFTLPFDTTYAWYVIANDSLQENQSDIWFFTTKQRPPENQKPVADPGGPYTTKLNHSVSFNGSQSFDPDGTIIFYRWNFGDGSSQILDIAPEHTYEDPGVYMVTLTVVDNDGRSSMKDTTATIQGIIFTNNPPIAVCNTPTDVLVDQQVLFDASQSNDSDGTVEAYRWDFNSDGSFDTDWLADPFITTSFSSPGPFVVTVEVIDDLDAVGSFSTTVSVKESSGGTPGFEFLAVLMGLLLVLYIFNRKRN